jgi:hypothetical protein
MEDGKPIFEAAQLRIGETIQTRLSQGAIISRVEKVAPSDQDVE